MENCLTKAITIVALTCFLVVGAAATAFSAATACRPRGPNWLPHRRVQNPVSNKESKKDKLTVATMALAAYEPPQAAPVLSEPLRQAYASTAPADHRNSESRRPRHAMAAPPSPAEAKGRRQAGAAKELRAAQRRPDRRDQGSPETVRLAGILLAAGGDRAPRGCPQDPRKAAGRSQGTGIPIDPEAEEVQQLKSAAMPLLFQLREDQKNEVRSLARIIGLEKVASMI